MCACFAIIKTYAPDGELDVNIVQEQLDLGSIGMLNIEPNPNVLADLALVAKLFLAMLFPLRKLAPRKNDVFFVPSCTNIVLYAFANGRCDGRSSCTAEGYSAISNIRPMSLS